MKRAIEIADLALKVLSCIAIIAAGGWAWLQFNYGGSDGWHVNMAIETQVLPYHDDLRLLVVHVKTKNPRPIQIELVSEHHDSYLLYVRRLPVDGKAQDIYPDAEAAAESIGSEYVKPIDLLARADGDYELLPGAEMDDMQTIVVPAGTILALTATIECNNGTFDKHGKPDIDTNSTSTVVHITP